MIKKLTIIVIFAGFGFFLINGGTRNMSIFGNEFQNKYKELFKDVEKLNAYTRTHKVELTGENIKDINLTKAEFHGATFKNVKWEEVTIENSIFNNVVFEDCEFINSNFNAAKLIDCVFKNCRIHFTKMNRAVFKNGQYIGCDIKNSGMVKWTGDEITFNGSKILDTPLAQGNIKFTFLDTDLDGVRVMMTEGNHPLLIEGGLLSEVDFSKSHFSTVTLRRVKQGEGGVKFNSITAKDILLDDVDLDGIGFMQATANTALIRDSHILAIGFSGGGVGEIHFSNSTVRYFDIAESMMPHVEFTKCKLYEPMLYGGLILELAIRESTITDMKGKNFKADIVVWDNVTLDGKIDLTNAQVKDFRPTRLKRGPKLNLITTGSNMRF